MAEAVGDIGDQSERVPFRIPENTIDGFNHYLDKINVFPLIEASDIIGFSYLTLMENKINGTGVIFDIEPIADIFALAINRKRLAVADIIDEQRNQFLGELIGPVVVRAVCDNGRQTVGVVVSPHEMIGRCLGGRIGRVRIVLGRLIKEIIAVSQVVLRRRCRRREWRFDAFRVVHFERSVNLVGRDMVEAFACIPLRQTLPVEFGSLQE